MRELKVVYGIAKNEKIITRGEKEFSRLCDAAKFVNRRVLLEKSSGIQNAYSQIQEKRNGIWRSI